MSLAGGKSAAVTTALTPSRASALEVSIETMRAWAWGLRRVFPCSRPAAWKSAPYCALPVTLSAPSWRIGRVPTTLKVSVARTWFGS